MDTSKTPRSGSSGGERRSNLMPPVIGRSSTMRSTPQTSMGFGGIMGAATAVAKLKENARSRREGPYGSGQAPVPDRTRRPPPSLQRLPTENMNEGRGSLVEGFNDIRGSIVDLRRRGTESRPSPSSSPRSTVASLSLPRTPMVQDLHGLTPGSDGRVRGSGVVYSTAFTAKRGFQPADIEAVLADLPLFGACSQQLLAALSESCTVREVAAGEEIVAKGDTTHGIVVTLKGLAILSIASVQCGRVPRGACFGETYLLGLEQQWTVTLISEVDCTVAELSREDFLQACEPFADVCKWYESIKKGGVSSIGEGVISSTCELFEGLNPKTLSGIDQNAVARVYFPGEVMVGQGDRSEELCILTQGRAAVQVAGRAVRDLDRAKVKIPACFGEPGLFGLRSPKGTCVLARSVCSVRIIYRSVFVSQMDAFQDFLASERVSKLLFRSTASTRSKAGNETQRLPLFEEIGCSAAFLQFISDNLEGRIFLAGTNIVDETAAQEPCLFTLLQGTATLTQHEQEVSILSAGAQWGERSLLGVETDRCSIVTARETCHVEVLHQSVIVRAMEVHPEDREKVLARALKLMKEMRNALRRSSGASKAKAAVAPKATLLDDDREDHSTLLSEFLTAPFFEGMSLECLEKISSVAQTQLYLPGEFITEQGATGDTMFIIVSGSASVLIRSDPDSQVQGLTALTHSPFQQAGRNEKARMSKVQDLKPGSVFGELTMLGIMRTRAATVQAETFSSLWEVHQAAMMSLVTEFPDAQQKINSIVSTNLESSVPARLQSLPLFKEFDQSFQMLLSLYCERRVYFPGERIAHGGRAGDGLYVVNVGEADFERSGVKMLKLTPGSHFGSTIMLGIHKLFLGTVDALVVCHVLVITRESYLMALERYPAPVAAQALKKAEAKAAEDLQARMRRTVLKEQVMVTCEEALREKLGRGIKQRKSLTIKQGSSNTETLSEFFGEWKAYAQTKAVHRRKEKRQAGKWCWWVSGRQVAIEQRMQIERQVMQGVCWHDEIAPTAEDPAANLFTSADQVRSPRWSRPLAPYAVDQAAGRRPRRPVPASLAPVVPGSLAATPDLQQILRAIDERQADAAALASARAKAPDGPNISLLDAAARAASAAAAAGLADAAGGL